MPGPPLQEFAMIRVLLVDDDQELTALLSEYLEREGFAATAVHSGEEGEVQALSGRYSICLLYTSPRPRDLSTSRMPSSA